MALPVIANVFRVVLNWNHIDGVQPHNVMNVFSDSVDVADIATTMVDAMESGSHLFDCVSSAYHIDSIDVTPLDGTSGGVVTVFTEGPGGGASGDPIPSVAGVLALGTGFRGPANRGRLFLGPVGEGVVAGGFLTGYADMSAGWAAFGGALHDAGIDLGVASYVHSTFHLATSYRMDNQIGTQRRRLLQTR